MPKGQLPGTSFQQGKKSFKWAVIEHMTETQKQVLSIKRDMNKEIEKRMEERHGDLIHQVSSALDGVIAIKEIFIEKGLFTREEYNAQKAKMRRG